MIRKIPATMATQHPDNAREAYWLGKKFINTLDEIEECRRCFEELKCSEYMWDWEGKFVEEAGFRLARAYMAILTADDAAHELNLHAPPM